MHAQILVPKRSWERQGPLYLPRYDRSGPPSRHRRRSVPSAAYSLVAHTGAGGTLNSVTTSAINTTGANLIVLFAGSYAPAGSDAISDSKSNTWTKLSTYSAGAVTQATIFYCYNPSVGTSHTFTDAITGGAPILMAAAFSGAASSPLDVQAGNSSISGTSVSLATGLVNPSVANELLFTGIIVNANNTFSINSGFNTPLDTVSYSVGVHFCGAWSYQIQTTATSRNPTFSWSSGGDCAGSIAAFMSSASFSSLFRPANLTTGSGGPFFSNPIS